MRYIQNGETTSLIIYVFYIEMKIVYISVYSGPSSHTQVTGNPSSVHFVSGDEVVLVDYSASFKLFCRRKYSSHVI